ncbi:MAG: nucleotide triphosphate diphosphatase NUDT15 [Chloroflexota bacterium]
MNAPRVGVGMVITRGDEVLLLRRKNVHGEGTWSTPGGHLECGESPEACAAREAREETGIEVSGVRFVGITNDVFDETRHYITIWMCGDYLSGEAHVAAEYESSQVGWFSWDALPQPLFLPLQHLLWGESYPPQAFQKD